MTTKACDECGDVGKYGNSIRRYQLRYVRKDLCFACVSAMRRCGHHVTDVADLMDHTDDFICLPWSDEPNLH